jgi:hypothetical protein
LAGPRPGTAAPPARRHEHQPRRERETQQGAEDGRVTQQQVGVAEVRQRGHDTRLRRSAQREGRRGGVGRRVGVGEHLAAGDRHDPLGPERGVTGGRRRPEGDHVADLQRGHRHRPLQQHRAARDGGLHVSPVQHVAVEAQADR